MFCDAVPDSSRITRLHPIHSNGYLKVKQGTLRNTASMLVERQGQKVILYSPTLMSLISTIGVCMNPALRLGICSMKVSIPQCQTLHSQPIPIVQFPIHWGCALHLFHSFTSHWIMIRRSGMILNKAKAAGGRTIVRDPRKKSVPAVRANNNDDLPMEQQYQPPLSPPLPMQPQQPGLGSYVMMGAGMSLGFALVGALFGGF